MPGPSIVVFAWGNPSRGDDALGLLLLDRLREQPLPDGITLIESYQLQIEHAEDLRGATLVLFVDAHSSCPPPCAFSPVTAAADTSYTSHALSPAALLHVYETITGEPAPTSFAIGIRGDSFELGAALSDAARANLEGATLLLGRLMQNPLPEAWREIADGRGERGSRQL